MKPMRGQLSYANVVSTLCLCLLVGGGSAFAATKLAKNSVGTKQIKNKAITSAKIGNGAVTGSKIANGAVSGPQINLSSLGTVPSAVHASDANTASNALNATNAVNASHAEAASVASSIAPPEASRVVGDPGQPLFAPAWRNTGSGTAPVAFYKDREGAVHLQGTADGNGSEELVFIVPTGYAPSAQLYFPAIPASGGALSVIRVNPLGEVVSTDKFRAHLDGITWRVAG
jgi:hypothetical protein